MRIFKTLEGNNLGLIRRINGPFKSEDAAFSLKDSRRSNTNDPVDELSEFDPCHLEIIFAALSLSFFIGRYN